MKTPHWKVKTEFPSLKVLILGILLILLGSACVVISVIGILKLAWGYNVATGMWGGISVTLAGLSAIYVARVRTSRSAKMYFFFSVLVCATSFVMLVLSAGGLTYRSGFYKPVAFQPSTHQITLFLHGSVLSISVIAMACNVLSVIVCWRFVHCDADCPEESFKLRRHRPQSSNPEAVYRISSLRGGSETLRSSTSSRTPLYSSDRSRRRSGHTSDSDCNSSNRNSLDRVSHRRDSDRSRGSSRSRHSHRTSHHRQSSSASQSTARNDCAEPALVDGIASREAASFLTRRGGGQNGPSSSRLQLPLTRHGMVRGGCEEADIVPVFDSDEEPLPPYEEPVTGGSMALRVEADSDSGNSTSTVEQLLSDGCGNISTPAHLPLNIPVEPHSSGGGEQSSWNRGQSVLHAGLPESSRAHTEGARPGDESLEEFDNRINHMQVRLHPVTESHSVGSPRPVNSHCRNGRQENCSGVGVCSEICSAMGEQDIPVSSPPSSHADQLPAWCVTAVRLSGTPGAEGSACIPFLNRSFDSSDTSLHDNSSDTRLHDNSSDTRLHDNSSDASLHDNSRTLTEMSDGVSTPRPSPLGTDRQGAFPLSGMEEADLTSQANNTGSTLMGNIAGNISCSLSLSDGSSCGAGGSIPVTFGSPNSAFRPVARRSVPVSPEGLASSNSSTASATAVMMSPSSSVESLSRSSALSWKDIPLPAFHNHSNRAGSAPPKELAAKIISGLEPQPSGRYSAEQGPRPRLSHDAAGGTNVHSGDQRQNNVSREGPIATLQGFDGEHGAYRFSRAHNHNRHAGNSHSTQSGELTAGGSEHQHASRVRTTSRDASGFYQGGDVPALPTLQGAQPSRSSHRGYVANPDSRQLRSTQRPESFSSGIVVQSPMATRPRVAMSSAVGLNPLHQARPQLRHNLNANPHAPLSRLQYPPQRQLHLPQPAQLAARPESVRRLPPPPQQQQAQEQEEQQPLTNRPLFSVLL